MVEESDARALLDYALENREPFAEWEPLRPEAYFTLEFWERETARVVDVQRAGLGAQFLLVEHDSPRGAIVGRCNLSNVVRGAFQAAHLGYSLDHAAWGRGLMTEGLAAVLAYAFDEMNLHRVMANYLPTNERSGAVLRRLGFVVEGYARDYLLIDGRWRDHILTSLTNPSWRPPEKNG